jgi:hypothetical protein
MTPTTSPASTAETLPTQLRRYADAIENELTIGRPRRVGDASDCSSPVMREAATIIDQLRAERDKWYQEAASQAASAIAAQDELAKLSEGACAPVAEVEQQAARYRWLRGFATPGQRPPKDELPMGYREIRLRVDTPVYMPANWAKDVDRMIDSAMKADAALSMHQTATKEQQP